MPKSLLLCGKMNRSRLILCAGLLATLFSLCPLPLVYADSLLLQDIPIFYGEERFLDRIGSLPSGRSEPLGLLLSGGSARAFAHIGVLQDLDERGLSPDFIVTNSMGSIVGMLYAAGISPDEILELIKRIELSTLFEPELPVQGGILNPSIFTELAKEIIIEDDIRNFPIPLIVVCEDLKTKRTILLAEGEVGAVLAASFALPVYFRPVELFGHSLIDGGLSNIAPVGIPYMFTDQVIASTTFYRKELDLDNPLTILNVAMDITKSRAGVKDLKEYNPVWIRCDVETFSFMDWSAMDEIVSRGYASACEELDQEGIRENLETGSLGYLDAVRSEASLRAERACREFERSGTVYFNSLEWGLKAGVMADGGPRSRALLQDRNRVSAGSYLKKGYAQFNVDMFYQPQWLNQFQSVEGNFTGAALGLEWMPARVVYINSFCDFNFTAGDAAGQLDFNSLYWYGEAEVPRSVGEKAVLGPFVRYETMTDRQLSPMDMIFTGGLFSRIGKIDTDGYRLNAEQGFFRSELDSSLQSTIDMAVQVFPFLLFEQRLHARYNWWDGSNVFFYPGDYFRGSKERELISDFLIGNSGISLQVPGWKPTFGETVILDTVSAGPFYDLRVSGAGFEHIAGFALDVSLSVIGLKPVSIHLDYGWENMEDGVFSFYLNI